MTQITSKPDFWIWFKDWFDDKSYDYIIANQDRYRELINYYHDIFVSIYRHVK